MGFQIVGCKVCKDLEIGGIMLWCRWLVAGSVLLSVHRPVPICAKRGVFGDTLPREWTCMSTAGLDGNLHLRSGFRNFVANRNWFQYGVQSRLRAVYHRPVLRCGGDSLMGDWCVYCDGILFFHRGVVVVAIASYFQFVFFFILSLRISIINAFIASLNVG